MVTRVVRACLHLAPSLRQARRLYRSLHGPSGRGRLILRAAHPYVVVLALRSLGEGILGKTKPPELGAWFEVRSLV